MKDASPLAGLNQLKTVRIRSNNGFISIKPFLSIPRLQTLEVTTSVEEPEIIKELESRGIKLKITLRKD